MKKEMAIIGSLENQRVLTIKKNLDSLQHIPVYSQSQKILADLNVGDTVYVKLSRKGPLVVDTCN